MNPGCQADNFNLSPAVIGNEGLFARGDQQVEGVVIASTLTGDKLRRFGRGWETQGIEAQQSARTQFGIILQYPVAPIKESSHHPMLVDAQPGAAGAQVLAAYDMGNFGQCGRGQG